MRQQMGRTLEDLGLSAAQYGALSELEQTPALTNAELARACYVTPQTMIRIVQDLKKRGFIALNDHADHGLKIQCQLTKKALDVLCKAHEKVYELEKRMVKGLKPSEVRELIEVLKKCFENLNS
jgi:DNA-binding MarR family transcriptional regulator